RLVCVIGQRQHRVTDSGAALIWSESEPDSSALTLVCVCECVCLCVCVYLCVCVCVFGGANLVMCDMGSIAIPHLQEEEGLAQGSTLARTDDFRNTNISLTSD